MRVACRVFSLTLLPFLPALAAERSSIIQRYASDTVVEADGSAVQTLYVEVAVPTDAAAQVEAEQHLTYDEGMEHVALVEGATIKPDGRRISIPPSAVRFQPAPATPSVPGYAWRKQVVVTMPNVTRGDTLSLTWRRTLFLPPFAGRYDATILFSRTSAWNDAEVTIRVPRGVRLNTEAHGPQHTETADESHYIHRWHWQAVALASDPAALSPLDRAPRIFASTFPEWAALSRAYAAVFAPKAEVTPRIQALADEVAAGSADRREEARRLYEWVSGHVHWVAIYVGDGAFVPHPADEVLANGYGDCKDQVALLTALLRARGIEARPVLINLGSSYTLSGPPTLTAFNHMIAYIPEWDLYADTTISNAPVGVLNIELYGKPILHLTSEGSPPARMGVLPPGLASVRLSTAARLEPDGRITGETVNDAGGPFGIDMRWWAKRVQDTGSERAAAEHLKLLGRPGTGEISPAPLGSAMDFYSISASFTLDARPGLLRGDAFFVPVGMRLLTRPGDRLLGPARWRDLPTTEPTPCYAGEQEEELSLALPPGYHVAKLPSGREIAHEAFDYESRWTEEKGVVRVVRRFTSRIAQPLCEGPLRVAAAKALDEIKRDQVVQITLEKD